MQYLVASQKQPNDLGLFPRQTINVTVIQDCAPTTDAEEVEVDLFYQDLRAILKLILKNKNKTPNIIFIIGD